MISPKLDPQAATSQADAEAIRRKLGLDQVRKNLAPAGQGEKKLKETTEGFEAMFIQKLWQQMRKSVPKEGYLHSKEEDAYLSMFEQELSKKMASAGGIGLGKMLYDELKEQLARSASATAPRGGQPAELNPLRAQPMELEDPAAGVKSLDEAGAVKNLAEAGQAPAPKAAGNKPAEAAPAPADSGPIEPRFNPLKDTDPTVRDAVSAPPEVMQRVMNLAARIEMRDARAEASARTPSANEAVTAANASGAAGSSVQPMHWPVQGDVVSDFGWRTDKVTGGHEWHTGLDIAGTEGDPVQSCWDGKVVFSGQRGRFGNMVIVEHEGGWHSYYGHNRVNLVSEGDVVEAGSNIAELGSTGRATEPTLHFEVRQGDRAENPQEVMERLQAGLSRTTSK